MSGPTFNQSHSGSGNNIVNFGKQAFKLTPEILEELVVGLRGLGPIEVEPHGVQASFPLARQVVAHLLANGVQATLGGGVGLEFPQPSGPLELRGKRLLVDASR